jgi:hypothetical protein
MPKLEIDIEARLANFQDGLDKIGRQGEMAGKRIEKAFGGLKSALSGIVAGLSVGAFAAFVKSGVDAADSLGKLSQKVGVTVEGLSALQYAAKLSDVSTEQLSTGLARLARTASDAAAGSKEAAQAFDAIGVGVKDAQGNLRGTEALLIDLADRFAGMQDGAGKTALAMRLFGRAGAELIPFLNLGRSGIEDLRKEAERLGIVIGTETAKKAEEFNDNMTRVASSVDAAKIALAERLLPAIGRVADRMADAVREGAGFVGILKSLTGLSPFGDLQRAQKELTDVTDRILANEAKLSRLGTSTLADGAAANIRQRIEADKQRANELIKLLGVLRGETDAFGAPVTAKPETRTPAPGLPDTTADAAAKQGQQFLDSIRKRITAVTENEYAVLRLEAAQRKVGSAAEPLIQQLQRETEIRRELKEAQERQEQAAQAEAARRLALVEGVNQYVEELERETSLMRLNNEQRAIAVQLLALEAAGADKNSEAYRLAAERIREAVQANAGAKVFESTRTEMEKARAEIDRLNQLFIDGAIDLETYRRAVEKLSAEFNRMKDSGEKAESIGKQLGLTFSSAFEDAIVQGKKFSDVLRGIAQDVARILVRKSITEPLADSLGGLLKGIKIPGFATGGSFMVGGSGGTDSQLVAFKASPNERVTIETPGQQGRGGGASYSFSIDARGADSGVAQRIEDAVRRAVQLSLQAVQSQADRGGSFARAVGRR